MGKKSAFIRWNKVHSQIRSSPNISKDKVSIMAYLSGDGYIKIREKGFHYEIVFCMDDFFVAKRIVKLFNREYNIRPKIRKIPTTVNGGYGYYKVEIKSKPVCYNLLSFGKYDSLNWHLPDNLNRNLQTEWIKCFFDCEAHFNKSRNHIQVKSINGNGLNQINSVLNKFNINARVYGPYNNGKGHNPYYMLSIYRLKDVLNYKKLIGFYHKKKRGALQSF